jgi:hypothetical protein
LGSYNDGLLIVGGGHAQAQIHCDLGRNGRLADCDSRTDEQRMPRIGYLMDRSGPGLFAAQNPAIFRSSSLPFLSWLLI